MTVKVHVIECTSNPVAAPSFVGQHWINTSNGNHYLAKGTATVNDWVLIELTPSTPVTIGTANSEGVASSTVRSDHVHAHGDQTVGTLHAAATTSVNGFMSSADKTKLNTVVQAWIQYSNLSTQTTTATNTTFTALTLDTDRNSFLGSDFTKFSATELQVNYTGYLVATYKVQIQNTSTNDKASRVIIVKNGTALSYTEALASGKTNAGRMNTATASIILNCTSGDKFQLGFGNGESTTDTIEVTTDHAIFSLQGLYKS
jgi:hypothetical protein